jgi:hypothetical protein
MGKSLVSDGPFQCEYDESPEFAAILARARALFIKVYGRQPRVGENVFDVVPPEEMWTCNLGSAVAPKQETKR